MKKVTIELYTWEGKFWPFEIKTVCSECTVNHSVIKRTIKELNSNVEIEFIQKPWLDNWFKVLLRGVWHAPIIFVNRKLLSQERTIKKEELKNEIMKYL